MSVKNFSYFNKFIWSLNVIAVILIILSAIVGKVAPSQTNSFSFLGLAYIPLLLVNVLFAIYWMIRKKKTFIISLVAIVLGYQNLLNTIAFNAPQSVYTTDQMIRVMSYNSKVFGVYGNKNAEQTRDEMLQIIRDQNPDILCLQEYYSRDDEKFDITQRIKNDLGYPYYHFGETVYLEKRKQHFGVITFSKYPIIRKDKLTFSNSRNNNCIISDINFNEDTIRVFNAHLQSIHLGKEVIIDHEKTNPELNENVTLEDSKIALKKLRDAYVKRAPQARAVARNISESPYPSIVCTDLNDNPVSYSYQTISQNMCDTFIKKGIGLGSTYAGPIPGLRIDYILTSSDFEVWSFNRIDKKVSDHYPIVTLVSLQD